MIYGLIKKLSLHAMASGIAAPEDCIYSINRAFALLKLPGNESAIPSAEDVRAAQRAFAESPAEAALQLEEALSAILDWAFDAGLLEYNSAACRDLLDTELMACFVPPPSATARRFNELYAEKSPRAATDWFYAFCRAANYIRACRVARDVKWKTETEFGALEITINLSKPEKDPRAIAAARAAKAAGYPKCQLCFENEGYAGRLDHPARGNLRIIPIEICGEEWGFQYSPYAYYSEHCIVINRKHIPMVIDMAVFSKLFDFVRQFPHYMIGSNADLPIVGGSILSHEHFQGGRHEFPMERAPVERPFKMKGFPDIEAGTLKWPMSVIRLRGKDAERLAEAATRVLQRWRDYTDEAVFIYAETAGEPHNTITPIARLRGTLFELDLVLRNNITTEEHPLGVFHPHSDLHHIKKENIGLIEVMGLAILPPRLKAELDAVAEAIVAGRDLRDGELTAPHAEWAENFFAQCTAESAREVIKRETGLAFARVLSDAGVFKRTPEGQAAFRRFADAL